MSSEDHEMCHNEAQRQGGCCKEWWMGMIISKPNGHVVEKAWVLCQGRSPQSLVG